MQTSLNFHGRAVRVMLTPAAEQRAKALDERVLLEVQIYFSCVLVKRVAIYSDTPQEGAWQLESAEFDALLAKAQPLTERLYVRFNTVMTKICPVGDYLGPPPVSDFKIAREEAYVPRWLRVDYRDGRWYGDYGWYSSREDESNTVQIRGAAVRASAG